MTVEFFSYINNSIISAQPRRNYAKENYNIPIHSNILTALASLEIDFAFYTDGDKEIKYQHGKGLFPSKLARSLTLLVLCQNLKGL